MLNLTKIKDKERVFFLKVIRESMSCQIFANMIYGQLGFKRCIENFLFIKGASLKLDAGIDLTLNFPAKITVN